MSEPILRVALPVPLRRLFDYLPPAGCDGAALLPGVRLRLPFGRRQVVGVLMAVAITSTVDQKRLKRVVELLDAAPLFTPPLFSLLQWAAGYYHHPIGEVFASALPLRLRQGERAVVDRPELWRLTPSGEALQWSDLGRAPQQQLLWSHLRHAPSGLTLAALKLLHPRPLSLLRAMERRAWVEVQPGHPEPATTIGEVQSPPYLLNSEQQQAVETICARLGRFQPLLLHGVTGSGKTEVYLQAIAAVLERGEQVLMLVPEIGLTPQLVDRFYCRFGIELGLSHSGLNDRERTEVWLRVAQGELPLLIGTRSALFTPFARLGLIVVDEEHDGSYKQQDHFRYHARDSAIKRAQLEGVPIVLGSASPSLESLYNVQRGHFLIQRLHERAGVATPPPIHLIDLRQQPAENGLSPPLLTGIRHHLRQGNQVLLFLNRRGYAPTLLCHRCGWVANCHHCDARLTLYAGRSDMICHHCGDRQRVPLLCPQCGDRGLKALGSGTERVELALEQHFSDVEIVRIDRDSTRRKGSFSAILEQIHSGRAQILVGTQMVAKGHHFPDVTLVAILNGDQGLFSVDFRGMEKMAQQLLQVAGRAGRGEKAGEVVIQTHAPDHPQLPHLLRHDYDAFAVEALAERQEVGLPPYTHLALFRAEAEQGEDAARFLQQLADAAVDAGCAGVELLGPIPAPMERRGGLLRYQLLLQAGERAALHRALAPLLLWAETLKSGRKVRWSLDVDPVDLY
ncbi:MAG: primosomal protein N' [Gammaproteobacteria bacterium]|nr:primosomal protein N' [Gammaproteobacteria bacterium]